MSRFEAIGNFVYEKGERIGCTVGEANLELARKLNAYQMRVERLKAEVERLRKAGDEVIHEWSSGDEKEARNFMKSLVIWNAAKGGKPSV